MFHPFSVDMYHEVGTELSSRRQSRGGQVNTVYVFPRENDLGTMKKLNKCQNL